MQFHCNPIRLALRLKTLAQFSTILLLRRRSNTNKMEAEVGGCKSTTGVYMKSRDWLDELVAVDWSV